VTHYRADSGLTDERRRTENVLLVRIKEERKKEKEKKRKT